MSCQIRQTSATTAKFKNFAVCSDRTFLDVETGTLTNIADIIAKTFGEDVPLDIQVNLKNEEDITPED